MHNLIPSVIDAMKIKEKCIKENHYILRPTYVAIISAKHYQSSAFHHLQDMNRIHSLNEFSRSFKNESNDKPVTIVTVGGGPDKHLWHKNTMECAID